MSHLGGTQWLDGCRPTVLWVPQFFGHLNPVLCVAVSPAGTLVNDQNTSRINDQNTSRIDDEEGEWPSEGSCIYMCMAELLGFCRCYRRPATSKAGA